MTISELPTHLHARHCSGEGCATAPLAALPAAPRPETLGARRSRARGRRERHATEPGEAGRHRVDTPSTAGGRHSAA
ncbi:MAG: hypothetical protein J0G30_09635 [Actinomycetales bacterium]|nr:hypothetical protein [Actinomycetales bacterium]